jgi:hypothetical protein
MSIFPTRRPRPRPGPECSEAGTPRASSKERARPPRPRARALEYRGASVGVVRPNERLERIGVEFARNHDLSFPEAMGSFRTRRRARCLRRASCASRSRSRSTSRAASEDSASDQAADAPRACPHRGSSGRCSGRACGYLAFGKWCRCLTAQRSSPRPGSPPHARPSASLRARDGPCDRGRPVVALREAEDLANSVVFARRPQA